MGKIYLIMGKSASGKDSVYRKLAPLLADRMHTIVTYTTRPMREGEKFRKEKKVVEERRYDTVYGHWYYFTADDGAIHLESEDYLCIGTLESLRQMQDYYGEEAICPIYIEVDDGIRLERALMRERQEENPRYEEMCRRFLADQRDFSEDKLAEAHIRIRIENKDLDQTVNAVLKEIHGDQS